MKIKNWLFTKLAIYSTLSVFFTCMGAICITYFWGYYNYENLFEDRIIQQYTREKNIEMGINNEWILGVTTDSIDVIEAVHADKVAKHIQKKALSQTEILKIYREKIGDNHLLYMIELDVKNGEQIYKYSVLKDIYKDAFKDMLLYFIFLAFIILLISLFIVRLISNKLYLSLNEITEKITHISYDKNVKHISIETKDKAINDLVQSFNHMKDSLEEKEKIQQSTLQYISHELKTPIMIINSYTESAKENIFPKGDLMSTLTTITNQTKRIKEKINDLLLITKASIGDENDTFSEININQLIHRIVKNMNASFPNKVFVMDLQDDIVVNGYNKRMETLFENLLHNQFKFAQNSILITAYTQDNWLTCIFFNDGQKIDDQTKANLFEPFSKGYNGSTGLGLSICKGIVSLHKGDIFYEETDDGVQFKLMLDIYFNPKAVL